ncbi:DUF4114 domain-containing protein [Roseomonas sp. HJA6]|uniref:DUF4114 domain-containing protein n=1 Tax=Roseomonas alba TaxID=2846776 RepID=A0ABS7AH64_9PROT|nr:DUF4114 domain-containing protein [Neoroseomonas alba]MBW6401647.1 DUF4114 domain-containing protein [Neoroseomonas alba]
MATTLDIALSTTMQTWLSQGGSGNGVSAYAILYGSAAPGGSADTPISSLTLVNNGVVQSGGSFTLDLTTSTQTTLYGGKVYFIIQSLDDPSSAIDPTTLSQSAITWGNAESLSYRYDSIEVSLTGSSGDAANLTSIQGFGIGMALSAETGSRSYSVSAGTLFTSLANAATDPTASMPAVTTFSGGGLAGQNREAASPAMAVAPDNDYPIYAASDWTNYIDALKHPDTPIVINGYFNGAGDLQATAPAGTPVIWRNAGFFSYRLEWVEKDSTFWLTPTEGSQIQGAIKLTPDALADSVYSTLGQVELYETIGSTTPFELYPGSSEMSSGANNAWGQVLQQLTLGLTAGYLQSSGVSPNSAVTAGIDLNKNYNWDPSYAFGQNTNSTLGADVTVTWDPFAQLFYQYSNSYGTQYADALMSAFAQGGPQLPAYANGQNISTLSVTLFADSEAPPAGDYTPPVIHDYVAGSAAGGQYEAAQWHENNPANVVLDFNPGASLAQSLVLRDDAELSIRILTGYNDDKPQWQDVALGGAGVTPWQNWTFAYANGSYSVSGNGGAGQTSQSLVLTGLPMADSGVGWYQIVVKSRGFEKVFNLYTTTFTPAPTTGDPNPIPRFSDFGSDPSLFGIDGLATLTAGTAASGGGLLTFSVEVTGVSPTLDLSLMQANTSSAFLNGQVTATAPVAGTLKGGVFTAVAGQTADVHDAGGEGVALSVTSSSGLLAFGWTGLNDAADTSTWTETFTNLVQGRSVAVIHIDHQGGSGSIAPLFAKADLAGGWQTLAAQQLGNGTYDVTMTAYDAKPHAPNAPDYAEPLTKASAALTVTVQLSELALTTSPDGKGLALQADDGDTGGNWIRFTSGAGSLPEGMAVALYATDADGHPVNADGTPAGGIAEAVLGWVGTVGSDDGASLVAGLQSIYLAADRHLHFALVDGKGDVPRATAVTMRDNGDGSFSLDVGGVALRAEVDNTLSADMQMASAQRMYGLPLVHLDHGQQVAVELTGSAFNANTLGFVRVDLNQATGEMSLDGIAYGDTDAFRDAVRGALDPGYGVTIGGSDFARTDSWTVAGETGFYAPVLLTQSGEIFVIGDAANAGGHAYIRTYGANIFGFEDLAYDQGSDFDYNDMVVTLKAISDSSMI